MTTCNQIVTVVDNQNPVVTAPADITLCGAQAVTFAGATAATATDNCSVSSITYSPVSGSMFSVGTTAVIATATDVNGNTGTATFNVIINATPTVSLTNTAATACLGTAALTVSGAATATQIDWYNGSTLVNTATAPLATGITVAGGNGYGSNLDQFAYPTGVTVDGSGNIYIADINNNRIMKWAPGATAGTIVAGGNGQGSGLDQLSSPIGVAVDGSGNIYIVDINNNRIMKWAPGATSGTIVAGGNGQGSNANQLDGPFAVTVDGSGNLYIADTYNHRVMKWGPNDAFGTTVAGGNGQGSAANQFAYATGVAVDGSGNVYVSDYYNSRIQKWAVGLASVTTVAGGNGYGSAANQLGYPYGVRVDGSGSVYVADPDNNRIQKWTPGAAAGTTVAGGNGYGSNANQLYAPNDMYVDGSGNVYVADQGNSRIQKWAPAAAINTTYTPTTAGSYTAVVTSVTGCTATTNAIMVEELTAAITGTTTACGSVSLTATGAGVGGSYAWSGGATPTTNVNSFTVSSTYTVMVTSAGGCTASTDIAVTAVDCSIIYTGTAACETFTLANVQGNAWFDIIGTTGIIASINPNGENLGNLTVTVGDPAGVLTNGALQFLGRDVDIQSSAYPNGATIPTAYSLRLYYYDSELTAYQTAINSSTTLTPTALNVAWASGGTGCDISSYVASASSNGLIDKADVAEAEYGTNNNGFYLQLGMAHFTLFAATTSIGTPLPVKLLTFTGYKDKNTHRLNWKTATEQNASHFEIETSPDPSKGGEWKTIGNVRAAGNSNTPKYYDFTNDIRNISPLREGSGEAYYYRLKMIDFDGQFEYSNVIYIKENSKATGIECYPNPTENVLYIDATDRTQPVTVTDEIGRIVQTHTTTPNTIDLSAFAKGIYIINIGEEHFRIVKM